MNAVDRQYPVETLLQDGVADPVALRRCYDHAIQNRRVSELLATLCRLNQRFPGDRNIQKVKIALYLVQQNYAAAMADIEAQISMCTPDDGLIDAALAVRRKLGTMSVADCPPDRPSVSLCMIVKDEADGLGACLHVAKKLVDEIIVVDTGSRDRSRDIALIFGASTFFYTWDNDFSAARNVSLSHARGDWILILDADEIIASKDHEALHKALLQAQKGVSAFAIETRNYSFVTNAFGWQANDGSYPKHEAGLGWVPSRKVRIFPNVESVRFCFPVHERVEPTLASSGIQVIDCPIPIHHYGDLSNRRKLEKARQYFEIGKAKLSQSESDPSAVRELAVQAGELELWHEAVALWQRLLKQLPDFVEAHVNIAGALWQLGQYPQSLEAARYAADLDPSIKEAWFNIAISQLLIGNADNAIDLLETLTGRHPRYLSAQFMLAASYGCLGNADRSLQILQKIGAVSGDGSIHAALENLIERLTGSQMAGYATQLTCLANQFKPVKGAAARE